MQYFNKSQVLSKPRLHWSFQCVCGQHLDTVCLLMPSVNAAYETVYKVHTSSEDISAYQNLKHRLTSLKC